MAQPRKSPTAKKKPWATPERLENIAQLSSFIRGEAELALDDIGYRKKAEKLIWEAWDELDEVMTTNKV